jgi:pimeloyl-ACP methyl ester carboxylesterase
MRCRWCCCSRAAAASKSSRTCGRSARSSAISNDSPRDHITPYDRFAWSDGEIEAALASGTQQRELRAYFGAAEYRVLARLARRAHAAPVEARAPRVIIVPGIMGSQLGLRRPPPLPPDIVWLDPLDIQLGRLAALALPGAPIVPLGVVLFSHLRLKLYLRAQGFVVQFHDYDWRLPVATSGSALAARLRAMAGTRVALVAHSMGGLVSRAALALPGTQHVERVVLLGTPNGGSFAAVQALRGTYAVVRKVARLALQASAEELAGETFSTFPSLYDLLPWGGCAGRLDLFAANAWPRRGPQPRAALLHAARAAHALLAPADPRFAVIAGVGQETVTAVTRRGDDFLYTLTRHGDGTVPLASAQLPGAASAYARTAHSELTRDPQVAAAVVDLLRHGATTRLPSNWRSTSRACTQVSDRRLRASHAHKVNWAALTPEERRLFLENLNEPPRFRLQVPRAARRPRRPRGQL